MFRNNTVCISLLPQQLCIEAKMNLKGWEVNNGDETHWRITASRYLHGSYPKTVVGRKKFSFNIEKCIPLNASYSPLWQSHLVSSYPAWCWNCSPKEIICSKENVTTTSLKTGKNVKFLQNWLGRGQREVSDSPEITGVPWDGSCDQHRESLFINISCFSLWCLAHQVLSHLHILDTSISARIIPPAPLQKIPSQLLSFYQDSYTYKPSLLENLSFQILVEPLVRLLDTRKKKPIFWILLDTHVYPGQPQNDT